MNLDFIETECAKMVSNENLNITENGSGEGSKKPLFTELIKEKRYSPNFFIRLFQKLMRLH